MTEKSRPRSLTDKSRPRNLTEKSRPQFKNIFGNCLAFRSTWIRLVFVLVLVGFASFNVVKLTCLHVFSSVLCFLRTNDVRFVFIPIFVMYGAHVLFMLVFLYLFTYTGVHHAVHVRWCSCRLTVTWWGPQMLILHQSSSRFLVRFVLLDL